MHSPKFGKTGLRGLKKCPKCSHFNGNRAGACKNEECTAVFKRREPYAEACRLESTARNSTLFSIGIKDKASECWGFVEFQNTIDSNMSQEIRIARCYVETCVRLFASIANSDALTHLLNCQHIQAALNCQKFSDTYLLKKSAVNLLNFSDKMKADIWKLVSCSSDPVFQRVSKTTMVVKMAKFNKYNLRFTHCVFYTTKYGDDITYKFNCFCYNYNYNSKKSSKEGERRASPVRQIKEHPSVKIKKKCIHFFACLSAFASVSHLKEEFYIYLYPYMCTNTDVVVPAMDVKYLSGKSSHFIEFADDNFARQMIELKSDDGRLIELHSAYPDESAKEIISADVCFSGAPQTNNNYTLQTEDLSSVINNDGSLFCGISPLDMQITLADGDNLIDLPPTVETSGINDEIFNGNLKTDEGLSSRDASTTVEISVHTDSLEIITIKPNSDNLHNECGSKYFLNNWFINETDSQSHSYCQETRSVCISNSSDTKVQSVDENKRRLAKRKQQIKTGKMNIIKRTGKIKKSNSHKSPKCVKLKPSIGTPDSCKLKTNVRRKRLKRPPATVNDYNDLTSDEVVPLNKSSVVNKLSDYPFMQWLSSVTESINEVMHYQLRNNPEPLVFYIPQCFFDNLLDRISQISTKRRLPNKTVTFERTDRPPFGTFIKFIWMINNVIHLKQIFETSEVSLELIQYFIQNNDGSYTKVERSIQPNHVHNEYNSKTAKQISIKPHMAQTYLKIGIMSPEQDTPTPFHIEWTPNFLPKSKMGQLNIRFLFGHKSDSKIHLQDKIMPG